MVSLFTNTFPALMMPSFSSLTFALSCTLSPILPVKFSTSMLVFVFESPLAVLFFTSVCSILLFSIFFSLTLTLSTSFNVSLRLFCESSLTAFTLDNPRINVNTIKKNSTSLILIFKLSISFNLILKKNRRGLYI